MTNNFENIIRDKLTKTFNEITEDNYTPYIFFDSETTTEDEQESVYVTTVYDGYDTTIIGVYKTFSDAEEAMINYIGSDNPDDFEYDKINDVWSYWYPECVLGKIHQKIIQ